MTVDALFRKLPGFKGKQRIASVLLKGRIAHSKNVWVTGRYGCTYLLPNLVESISKEVFINGIYEKETSDFIVKRLPANGVFLDLGANIGTVCIPVCKQRKDVSIVCVEAAPVVFNILQQNLEKNDCRVKAVNKALFYEDNLEIDFYAPD